MSEKTRITCSEVMYYIFFAILFGYRAIGGVDGPAFYTPMILLACLLFVGKVLMTRHTVGELVVIGLLYLCAGITYVLTGEKGLLIDYALMLGMKGIPEKRLCRFAAWILGASMFVVTMPYALGILEDTKALMMSGRHAWMPRRFCLGYPHTNTLLTTYIILMMLVMYGIMCRTRDMRDSASSVGAPGSCRAVILRSSLILGLAAFYFWLWCDSRTGALITVLYLLFNLYFAFFARFGRFDKLVIYGLYPAISIASIAGTFLYGTQGLASNAFLQSFLDRFRLTNMYLQKYPLSLFGVRIVIPEGEQYAIDVSQMHLLLNLGILAFATVSVLYFILLVDCVRGKRRAELPIVLCLMIMGISDPLLYNLSCKNLTFLFMGAALYRWFAARRDRAASAAGIAAFWHREIRILPVGGRDLPRLGTALDRFGDWVCRTFTADRKRFGLSLIIALITALTYHLCTFSQIEPFFDSLSAGLYKHALHTMSFGVYGLLISYGLLCIVGSFRRQKTN